MSEDRFELFKEYCLGTKDCGTPDKFISAFEKHELEEKEQKEKDEDIKRFLEYMRPRIRILSNKYDSITYVEDEIIKYPGFDPFPVTQEVIGHRITIEFKNKEK